MKRGIWWALLPALMIACSDDETAVTGDDTDIRVENDASTTPEPDTRVEPEEDMGTTTEPDATVTEDAGMDMNLPTVCRTPSDDKQVRKLVVARPYDENGASSGLFVVHDVALDGSVSPVRDQFTLGNRAVTGKILFTPDGEVGFVRLDRGEIGIFRFNQQGGVEVIDSGFMASKYVSKIFMDPTGEYLYMLNSSFRNVDGGIYRAKIECDTGTLRDEGLIQASKLAYNMAFSGPEKAFLAAVDVADSEEPNHVHELAIGQTLSRVASGLAFVTDDVGLAGFAITRDAKFGIVGDAGLFSNNSISVVTLPGGIEPVQNFPVVDPQDIVVSPYNNAAIVLATQDDDIFVYDVNTANNEPLTLRGSLTRSAPSLLPSDAVMIDRGDLRGHVYITENVAIRHIAFRQGGSVDDLGLTGNGEGLDAISGAIGVQP